MSVVQDGRRVADRLPPAGRQPPAWRWLPQRIAAIIQPGSDCLAGIAFFLQGKHAHPASCSEMA